MSTLQLPGRAIGVPIERPLFRAEWGARQEASERGNPRGGIHAVHGAAGERRRTNASGEMASILAQAPLPCAPSPRWVLHRARRRGRSQRRSLQDLNGELRGLRGELRGLGGELRGLRGEL